MLFITRYSTKENKMEAIEKLNLFVNSHSNDLTDDIIDEIISIGKKMEIVQEDATAIFTEIGANVNEENGHKMRAILGRWVNNADYKNVLLFLLGCKKLNVLHFSNYPDRITKLTSELGLETDLTVMCTIAFAWCMLIETGVAAEKGARDNTVYMPETLEPMIFVDHLSRIKENVDKEQMYRFFKCLMEIFIDNMLRYVDGKTPHESDHAYLAITKEGYKRIGHDPAVFAYRCLDYGRQNWNLFFYLTQS